MMHVLGERHAFVIENYRMHFGFRYTFAAYQLHFETFCHYVSMAQIAVAIVIAAIVVAYIFGFVVEQEAIEQNTCKLKDMQIRNQKENGKTASAMCIIRNGGGGYEIEIGKQMSASNSKKNKHLVRRKVK